MTPAVGAPFAAQIIADWVDTEVIPSAPFREVVKMVEQIVGFRGATGAKLEVEFSRVRSDAGFPYPWWTPEVETSDDVEARVAPLVDELAEVVHRMRFWSGTGLLWAEGRATCSGVTRRIG